MNTERRVDAVCEFLRGEAAPRITLKKAFDDDMNRVEWVHPEAYPLYLPRPVSGRDWKEAAAPGIVVSIMKDSREMMEGLLTLRIGVIVWDPGTRREAPPEEESDAPPVIVTDMNRDGWRSLHAATEAVESALVMKHSILDMAVTTPIVYTPFSDGEHVPDLRPYYIGQLDVPMLYKMPRRVGRDIANILA